MSRIAVKDLALIVLVQFLWGFNFVVIKYALEDFPPIFLSGARYFIGALPFLPFVWSIQTNYRDVILLALFQSALLFGMLFWGMQYIGAGLSSVLLNTQALFTALLALAVLGESLSGQRICAILLGLVGVGLIAFNNPGGHYLIGVALTLAAALSWAIANVLLKRMGPVNMFNYTIKQAAIAWIPLLLLSALLEGPQVASLPATVTLRGVAALLYIAFIASVLGYWLWFRLIQQYPVSQISMFAMLSPVFSFVTGYVLLNEEWTVVKLSGAGLVLLALYVANTGRVLVFGRAAPTPPSTASRPR